MFRTKDEFKEIYEEKIQLLVGKSLDEASMYDKYVTLANIVREMINKKMAVSNKQYQNNNDKQVFYFSLEFLMGKLLDLYLGTIGIKEICREGLEELGINLSELELQEPEAGLGNGGLGRLAACFLDSLSNLGMPGHGCGIRYKYGLFKQKVIDGYQVELPDNWMRNENVWEIKKNEKSIIVRFGGNIRTVESNGTLTYIHENYEPVLAVPYDIPILGFDSEIVNTLRLWSAEPVDQEFDFASFCNGNYSKALEYKNQVEAISEVLYPDDSNYQNRVLRLKQEYFMVSAGVQSIIRRFKKANNTLDNLSEKIAIHINDTHPALAIPEFMRILVDEEGMDWDKAWTITTNTISYTNHTIMPEALEKWPVDIMKQLLPRIYLIINEINERFCKSLWDKYPNDWDRIRNMAIISDEYVKMAHLAIVGSYSVNGVAEVHSEILKTDLLNDFHKDTPHKFNNKTNGITHRRWLIKSNPSLSGIITEAIGDTWIHQPAQLEELVLRSFDKDASFQNKFKETKQNGKILFAKYVQDNYAISLDTSSIFDVQVKRIHAYKRQLLNALNILHLYNTIKDNPQRDFVPRTFIFAGKAAPSYHYAKKIIKFISTLSDTINSDKEINGLIKVVFLEDYSVSMAEMIFPAADISEQISTASKEASGTGNMKFMMNGAVTIGTMDGANIEISNAVGESNILTFGLSVDQVLKYYSHGGYCSYEIYNSNDKIKRVLDQMVNGYFSTAPRDEFVELYKSLLDYNDEYFILGDFEAYDNARESAAQLFTNDKQWLKMCINNLAMSGKFSSDETIRKYAAEIWKIQKSEARVLTCR